MFLSIGTTGKVWAVLSAAITCEVHWSGADYDGTDVTPVMNNAAIAASGDNTAVAAPGGAGVSRNVKHLVIRNVHASTQVTVTVESDDGTDRSEVFKAILLAGEALYFVEGDGWSHVDVNGYKLLTVPGATDTAAGIAAIATQTDMETATNLNEFVVPGRQHFHPGHPKCWLKTTGGASPVVSVSYNITSITDTLQGRLTVTIATDFSSANWVCQVSNEAASNATAVANRRNPCVANAGQAAGTVEVNCWDQTATNAVLSDPTAWHVLGHGDHA